MEYIIILYWWLMVLHAVVHASWNVECTPIPLNAFIFSTKGRKKWVLKNSTGWKSRKRRRMNGQWRWRGWRVDGWIDGWWDIECTHSSQVENISCVCVTRNRQIFQLSYFSLQIWRNAVDHVIDEHSRTARFFCYITFNSILCLCKICTGAAIEDFLG